MKKTTLFLYLFFEVSLLHVMQGCATSSDTESTIIISGKVVDEVGGNPVTEAIVQITDRAALRQETLSDSTGGFSFTVQADSALRISIEVSKTSYHNHTEQVTIAPGLDITDLAINLQSENTGGGDDDGEGVSGESGGAAFIILTDITEETINIEETGGIVNSAFTFQVVDSAGRTIDLNHAVDMTFSIVGGTGGSEYITPEVVRTNANGEATSNLNAGNTAGVVKIEAEVVREDIGLTIRSKPVAITIHGGFPDLAHFSISAEIRNFECFTRDGIRDAISVIVGDKFSNPVKTGTAVWFKTSALVIQGSGQGHTDDDGQITVDIISGGERSLLNHPDLGFGYATVTAYTFDENDQQITRSINILCSGPPSRPKINLNPSTATIPANGGQNFELTVTDINNNPLPAGTTVTVEVAEGLEVTGGDIEIPNALLPGPGSTIFEFSVADIDDEHSHIQPTKILIKVETPFGDKAQRPFGGTRAKAIGR